MEQSFEDILGSLSEIRKTAQELREILLANLVMVGEIPAPTFGEDKRMEFVLNRFKEASITKNSVDEVGNGIGILEGKENSGNVLVVAHADTVFNTKVDHTIQIQPESVTGAGVADNSLGLAVLSTLPTFLEKLDIELNHNLILMGATRSLGRGDLEGLRFFLSNFEQPIKAGVGIEGVELGRLSHTSIGMKRGEITCRVPEEYDWSRFGDASAILTLNEVINHINEIRLPQRPRTSIVMGSIEGGSSFNTTALKAKLQFEIRSESSGMVQDIHRSMEEIVTEVASQSGDTIHLDIFAQREPGGVSFSHPLIRHTRRIMDQLDIAPRPGPSTSELSAFIDKDIPAITLGLTHGDNIHETNESIEIKPIYTGIAQIIGTLLAIDGGYCEEA
ncbi:Acetylornithine deacetylase/Succinyl-diaminopimelate desuccinylase [Fodinibius roseus]|uniref:Acetylornithine deacetylase/Succinyl-diaminopimelate desuccinylase n=1 Tax=Fodinibius roseus TaxID=1194090 RepID=A0A1M4TQR7_9BACT|nr:peptidase dimerization domain-containing protein [Fodinibius roseus]SHE46859.1 Acetylornithine deacetylase/Succinyl-diaminopimelate desuccinylase [Fodinibius roseus]